MERRARLLSVVAALLFAMSLAPIASAKPKPPEVLHPHFRLVANGIGDVRTDEPLGTTGFPVELGGRYVLIQPTGAEPFAIDEQTGQRSTSSAPGCSFFDLVGPNAVFSWCDAINPGPGTFAIHDLASGTYRALTLSPEIQHFDDLSPICGAFPVLLGDNWAEFDEECNGKTDQPFSENFVFENTNTAAYSTLAAWKPEGRIVPNLNSPQLGQRLCPSLRTPARAPKALVVDERHQPRALHRCPPPKPAALQLPVSASSRRRPGRVWARRASDVCPRRSGPGVVGSAPAPPCNVLTATSSSPRV